MQVAQWETSFLLSLILDDSDHPLLGLPSMRMFLCVFLCVSLVGCQGDESVFDPFKPTWCELALERNDDGFFSQIRYLTYNDNGDMIQMDWDYRNDGDIDLRFYQQFDEKNYLIRFRKEPVGAGTGLELLEKFENDSNGRILIYSRDDGDDGVIDLVRINTWGKNGLTLSEYDDDVNGAVDYSGRYIYEGGDLIREEYFSPGNEESPYSIVDYFYDNGLMVQMTGTSVFTNEVYLDRSFTYDSDRRPTGGIFDGTPTTYTYDEEGRLVEVIEEEPTIKFRSVLRYTCESRSEQRTDMAPRSDIHGRLTNASNSNLRLDGSGEGLGRAPSPAPVGR